MIKFLKDNIIFITSSAILFGVFVGVDQLGKIPNLNQASTENSSFLGVSDPISGVNTVDSQPSVTSKVNSTIESYTNNTPSTTPSTFHRKAPRVIDDDEDDEYEDD